MADPLNRANASRPPATPVASIVLAVLAFMLLAFVLLAPDSAYLLKGSAVLFALPLTAASVLLVWWRRRKRRAPRWAIASLWLLLGPAWLGTVALLGWYRADAWLCSSNFNGCPPRARIALCRRLHSERVVHLSDCERRYAAERRCTDEEAMAIREFDCGGWGDLHYVPARRDGRIECGPAVCLLP